MTKQRNLLLRPLIALTFSGMMLMQTSCKDSTTSKQQEQAYPPSTAKPGKPAIDIHAAVISGNIDVLKQHIAAGTHLDEKDPLGGSSPLITACVFGKTEMAALLIDAGASLNFQNNDGSTPLHTAAFFCRPEIVTLLLNRKADRTIKNKYGQTAYETVAGPYESVKSVYMGLGQMLEPMGLKLDYAYIEKTRPQMATMLK